jgi:hypothetical protein
VERVRDTRPIQGLLQLHLGGGTAGEAFQEARINEARDEGGQGSMGGGVAANTLSVT